MNSATMTRCTLTSGKRCEVIVTTRLPIITGVLHWQSQAKIIIAVEHCTRSIDLSIQSGEETGDQFAFAYNNRCLAHIQLGNLEHAQGDCEKALELGHSLPAWPLTNLGRIALLQGEYYQAATFFGDAIRADVTYAPAYAGLGDIYTELKQYSAAQAWYQEYLKFSGHHTDATILQRMQELDALIYKY